MRYCGRAFTDAEIELIRALIGLTPPLNRAQLSREACERLGWRRPDGRLKDMSCRVALLRMQADGLITLPPPRNAKPPPYLARPEIEQAVLEPPSVPAVDLARLTIDPVGHKRESLLWNAYIQRHHYLGHQLMPGAQLRYFVRAAGEVVALLSFGASAWKTQPRDEFIGWTREQRERNLHLIINNARVVHDQTPIMRLVALADRSQAPGLGVLAVGEKHGILRHQHRSAGRHHPPGCRRNMRLANRLGTGLVVAEKAICSLRARPIPTRLVDRRGGRLSQRLSGFDQAAKELGARYVIRACRDRKLVAEESAGWETMIEALAAAPVLGSLEVAIPGNGKRKARTAVIEVKVAQATIQPPQRRGHARDSGSTEPITVQVIGATESAPPKDQEAVSWVLLTNLAVADFEAAREKVQWYGKRWGIETGTRS